MSCSTIHSGKDTIKMMKDIFDIGGDLPIVSIVMVANIGEVTTLNIECLASVRDIDITSTEISRDSVIESSTYEVTIKRINPKSGAADIKPDLRCDADLVDYKKDKDKL